MSGLPGLADGRHYRNTSFGEGTTVLAEEAPVLHLSFILDQRNRSDLVLVEAGEPWRRSRVIY